MGKRKSTRAVETAFNQYELIEIIGEGGAGRVWRATDFAGNVAAIKMLAAERATKERRRRFKNEVLFCQRTRHANVVQVLDHGVANTSNGSAPFYVMPLLEGSARKILSATTNADARLKYFDQVLNGVEAAHLAKVTHRDLKPENILYDKAGDRLVVADFGIALFTDEELYTAVETRDDARLANFQYAAPEQRRRGGKTDERTDIYALGLILNEMFTGEVPHGAGYRRIVSVLPEFSWVDEIVDSMILQDPNSRPRSIDAIKQQFIACRRDHITRQKLSELSNRVIDVEDDEDPLITDPPRIVDFEWGANNLTLVLSQIVNRDWIQALIKGHGESIWGKGPDAFQFNGNRASVSIQYSDVQRAIDYFKKWIPRATRIYREKREREREKAAEGERLRLQNERDELERQRRLREEIRL